VVEEPKEQQVEEDAKRPLQVLAQPDELRWWELQLGVRLVDGLYTEIPTGR
jgi:hypothetical protein